MATAIVIAQLNGLNRVETIQKSLGWSRAEIDWLSLHENIRPL
jgi:hypothetical protein